MVQIYNIFYKYKTIIPKKIIFFAKRKEKEKEKDSRGIILIHSELYIIQIS